MTFLATLPAAWGAIIVVLASCALSVLPYLLARKILLPRADNDSKDLASSVLVRIGILHGLILALTFAQELLNFNEARHTMTREAALVGDIYYDLKRYDDAATRAARDSLARYTEIVLDREWKILAASGRLDERAWTEWKSAYLQILDLAPENPRQEALKPLMVDRAREISELRIQRESSSLGGTNNLFLFAAIGGIVIISIAYFPFPPGRVNLVLLLLFGIYAGLVIYFIIAFSNPYSGPGHVEPVRLQRLYEGMLKSMP